jgi:hypothetical protein
VFVIAQHGRLLQGTGDAVGTVFAPKERKTAGPVTDGHDAAVLPRPAPRYDALGVFGATFRDFEWETLIFSWSVVPKNPNGP